MIIAKFSLVFGVVVGALVFSLQVLGIMQSNQTFEVLFKVLGLLSIFAIAGGLIGLVSGGRKNRNSDASSNTSSKSGPQF